MHSDAPPDSRRRLEATVVLPEDEARRVAATLGEIDEAFVVVCHEADGGWAVQVFLEEPDADRLPALMSHLLGRETQLMIAPVADRDWVALSLEGLKPVPAGRFVVFGRHDRARVPPHRIGIEIEAGLAFGTGHHSTTLGCLLALEWAAKTRRHRSVLDLGTGTGILAMAAAKRLRVPVLASDIDPVSVRVARDNVRLNGLSPLVRPVVAAGTFHREIGRRAPYDLVFANILAGPLVALAPGIARLLARRATLILSGLLVTQERRVLAAYRAQGLVPARRIELGEWSTLVLEPAGMMGSRHDVSLHGAQGAPPAD